jgi:hypothetical protein
MQFVEVSFAWNGPAPSDADFGLSLEVDNVDPVVFEATNDSGTRYLDFKGDESGRYCWHVKLRAKNLSTGAC